MEGITLNTLPAWIPGIIMLYTAFIWLVTRKLQIRMDSRVVAYTMLSWGSLYLLSALAPDRAITVSDMMVRVFMSRVVICFICLSQSVPMTVSYWRSIRRGEDGQLA